MASDATEIELESASGTFEADAQEGKPKFFVTFPHATVSHHKTIKGGEG